MLGYGCRILLTQWLCSLSITHGAHTPLDAPSASAASLHSVSSPRSLNILFLDLLFDYEIILLGKRITWTGSASPGLLLQTSIFVSDMLL